MLTAELAVLVGASLGAIAAHGRWRQRPDGMSKMWAAAETATPPDAPGQARREPPSADARGAEPAPQRVLVEGSEPR